MAEKKTIELEVKSNLGESISDLKALKRQLKDTAAGSEEFKKIFNQIDDLEDKIKSAKNTSSDWIDSLESAGGPIGALGASLNRAKVATQSFGGALKATGIGLVVALIGGLVAAFQDNEVAMKKLQPLLDGLGKLFQGVFRAVEPLFNTLVDLAISALPTVSKAFGVVYSSVTAVFQSLGMLGGAIKKLISGDFSGAWKDAKSSVNDFSKNYDASIKRFNEGSKEMSKTEKEEAEKRAEARKKAQEKREQDQEKAKQTAIEKAKAEADALKKIEEDRIAAEMASAQEVMDKEKALREAQETPTQKEEREYQEWLTKYQANNLNTELLDKQHKDYLQKQDDDYAVYEYEQAAKEVDDDKIAADKKAQDEIDAQKRKYEALSLVTQGGMNLLAALQDAGIAKSKAGQMAMKALTLVQIGIDTASAFSNAVPMAIKAGAEAAKLAGPGAPIVGPLATAASYLSSATMIASNIAKAKKLLSSGGSATPASGGGGGGTAPAPAAPAFNVVGASSTNQLAQTIGNQQQQPIKAYVVANDVTTQQSLDRNIVSSASIG
jgi:DNA segregation ATPase FtsK/SpoIIIE-like protein